MKRRSAPKKRRTRGQHFGKPDVIECRPEPIIFDDLKALATEPGYIHALAALAFKSNVLLSTGSFTSEDFAPVYDKERLLRTEINLLLGLMLTTPIKSTWPGSREVSEHAARSLLLMEELHQAVLKPGHEDLLKTIKAFQAGEEVEPPLGKGIFLREAIFYGPESAFPFQYIELARKRYAPDRDWLKTNKGFDIDEAASVIEAIRDRINSQILGHANALRLLEPSELVERSFLDPFGFHLDDVTQLSGLPADTVRSVLAAFTYPIDDRNNQFVGMSAYNKASVYPIFEVNDYGLVSLLEYSLAEALYENPFYWIAEDKKYLGIHSQTRGKFTETFTRECLEKVFGDHFLTNNVVLFDESGRALAEADSLLIYGRRAYVIQAKSKRLTMESRAGDDVALAQDFQKAVQEAYNQATAFITGFQEGSEARVGGQVVDLPDRGSVLEFYPICVTSEHYPALSFQSREFLKVQELPKTMPPLVFDVFSMDVIAEFLSTPLLFADYLAKRAAINDQVVATHELVVLGYHLRKNLHLGDYSLLTLDDSVLVDVDLAMAVRRTGLAGPGTPPGILTRFQGTPLAAIFDAVNESTRPDVHRLGELLLGISGEAADTLNRSISKILTQTKLDGGEHDITMGFETSGITIHCNRLPDPEARKRLLSHVTMRKYVQKRASWYGVTLAESGVPRLMLGLEHEWTFDSKLENLVGDFKVRTVTHALGSRASRKIGRNTPCPCGSGLKYKRCHGR